MGIRITNLQKKYGERNLFKNANLYLPDQGLYFVVGQSGSGKSTFLNLLATFDKQYDGKIALMSGDMMLELKEIGETKVLSEVFDFIFQDYNLINSMNVRDNIRISELFVGKSSDDARCRQVCEELGIEELYEKNVRDLSGGEKQRVAIARAIIRDNPIILADEPTGNLDRENGEIIFELLKILSRDKLVVVVSHNEEAANRYGDGIIRLAEECFCPEKEMMPQSTEKCMLSLERANHKKMKIVHWFHIQSTILLSNIKYRFKKIIPMLTILCICISCFGLVLALNNGMKIDTEDALYRKMQYDQLMLYNNKFDSNGKIVEDYQPFFSEKLIKQLKDKKEILDIQWTNTECFSVHILGEETSYVSNPEIIVIGESEIYTDRYELEDGEMPAPGQIMLSPKASQFFFGNSYCVDNELVVETLGKKGSVFSISGVTKVDNTYNGEIYITQRDSERLFLDMVNSSWGVFDISVQNVESEVVLTSKIEPNRRMLEGRLPKNDSEVVISETLAKKLYGASENDYFNVVGKEAELYFRKEKFSYLTVVGVMEDAENYENYKIFVNRDFSTEDICRFSKRAYLYVDDISEDFFYSLNEEVKNESSGYYVSRNRAYWTAVIHSSIENMKYILLALTVIVTILGVCMIHYAVKVNVIERQYEIGVLRSLGAGKKFVTFELMAEQIVFGLISFVISALILLAIDKFKMMKFNGVSAVHTNVSIYFWMLLMDIIIVMVSGVIDVIRASRKPIVEAIKTKHL